MTRKKTLLCFLAFIAAHFMAAAQSEPGKRRTATRETIICEDIFPKCFIGNWKGTMQWMIAGKPTRPFTMRLNIQQSDTAGQYTWQIIYGDSSTPLRIDNRPYILKPIDTAKGHWIIDENDGIILDSYVHGNSIHGAFTVQGNTIIDNYSIEDGKMRVEFFSIKLDDKKQSGKGTAETPFVDSYLISSYQTGWLTKVK
jgi:hypothetical protein